MFGTGKADELAIIPVLNRRQRNCKISGARKINNIALGETLKAPVSVEGRVYVLLWYLLVGRSVGLPGVHHLELVTPRVEHTSPGQWHAVVRGRQSTPSWSTPRRTP